MEFMLNDFLIALFWWLHLVIIGLIFLPIANKIFSRFFDRGYLFSRIIGIVVSAYCVWLLSSFKIFRFSRTAIYAVITVAVLLIFFYFLMHASIGTRMWYPDKTFIHKISWAPAKPAFRIGMFH